MVLFGQNGSQSLDGRGGDDQGDQRAERRSQRRSTDRGCGEVIWRSLQDVGVVEAKGYDAAE